MSFGFSPSDIVALIALTTRAYKGWRDACAEYSDITGSLDTLSRLLRRLETYIPTKIEIDASEEAVFGRREALRRDLAAAVRECRRTVASLNDILAEYRSLGTSKRRNWDRIRFGTKNIDSLRTRLTQHLSSIAAYLTVVELESIGRIDQNVTAIPELILQRLPLALGSFIDARVSDNLSTRGGSCLTTYTNDDKHVWREFRRECVRSGIKSEEIKEYRSELRRFFQDLIAEKSSEIVDVKQAQDGEDDTQNTSNGLKSDANLLSVEEGEIIRVISEEDTPAHIDDPTTAGEVEAPIASEDVDFTYTVSSLLAMPVSTPRRSTMQAYVEPAEESCGEETVASEQMVSLPVSSKGEHRSNDATSSSTREKRSVDEGRRLETAVVAESPTQTASNKSKPIALSASPRIVEASQIDGPVTPESRLDGEIDFETKWRAPYMPPEVFLADNSGYVTMCDCDACQRWRNWRLTWPNRQSSARKDV